MWQAEIESLNEGQVQRFVMSRNGLKLSYADVLTLWRDDADFRTYFIGLLADSPFDAYRWETPCVTAATLRREFEFVLLRSDGLARAVDAIAFKSHFSTELEVATFPNLGGDAVMVVPACNVFTNSFSLCLS